MQMDFHRKRKPFKCDQCNYSSSRLDHLKVHKYTDTGEKPYKCNPCDCCFAHRSNLKYMLIHSNDNGNNKYHGQTGLPIP